MNKRLLMAIPVLLLPISASACAKIILINNGTSKYEILVAAKEIHVAFAGTQDLQ